MSEKFETTVSQVFEVNKETRTIKGLALPFGVVGQNGSGRFQFDADAEYSWPTDLTRLKLFSAHDYSRPIGFATRVEKTDRGIEADFKIGRGAAGDQALIDAEDHVSDGLSVGLGANAKFVLRNGVQHGKVVPIAEVSQTPLPAFDDARVVSVAASAANPNKEGVGVVTDEIKAEAPDFGPLLEAINGLGTKIEQFASIPPREPNPQAMRAFVKVQEESPYRFDGHGIPGQYDFSTDLFAGARGNGEAMTRVNDFIKHVFDAPAQVATTDVDEVNPVGYRPDLYVDYIGKTAPVYSAIHSGSLSDATPFVVPVFNTATDLVDDHVEGSEPAANATFTTTAATVTPAAISGQAVINREVVDAGGNPVVSALIWKRMNQAYAELLEVKAAALLNGATLVELGGSAVSDPADLEAALAGAVFIDGSGMWNFQLMHRDLFAALAAEVDGIDRPLYPILAAQNAQGTTASKFRTITVGGYEFVPAGSLGATGVNMKSFIGSTDGVGFWNSAPQRIELAQTVATVSFGLFGYWAGKVLDANKIRKITFSSGTTTTTTTAAG